MIRYLIAASIVMLLATHLGGLLDRSLSTPSALFPMNTVPTAHRHSLTVMFIRCATTLNRCHTDTRLSHR